MSHRIFQLGGIFWTKFEPISNKILTLNSDLRVRIFLEKNSDFVQDKQPKTDGQNRTRRLADKKFPPLEPLHFLSNRLLFVINKLTNYFLIKFTIFFWPAIIIYMYLSIKISRLSNLLFFAQKTDGYNLIKFDLRKYLIDGDINRLFYGENKNKIWKQIEESIGTQKAEQIKKAIISLDHVFTPHWCKASRHLLLWKQYFQNNQSLLQQVILELKKLSGIKHSTTSKIPIYLISDPISNNKEISAWFSWTPKESFIVVEIPLDLKAPNNFFPLAILAHEFFHLMLRKNKSLFLKITNIAKKNDKLFAKLSKGMPNRIFLEELLISSFIPEGYLSEKYFNTKVAIRISKPKDLLSWRKFIAFKLYQTAKKYIDNIWQIDENYLKDLILVIKQNVK